MITSSLLMHLHTVAMHDSNCILANDRNLLTEYMYAQYESTDGSFLLPLSRDRSRECESSLIQILARTKNCAVFKNKNYDVSKLRTGARDKAHRK